MQSPLIAAYSGGTLPAAIGIVRLSGGGALDALAKLFVPQDKKAITDWKNRTLYYGTLLSRGQKPLDKCLCAIYRAPHSYTGEDMVEFFCHGSAAVVAELLQHAYQCGARPAEAGEFTRRACLSGRMSLPQAEAVGELLAAEHTAAAEQATAQLSNTLRDAFCALRGEVQGLLAHFYAVCDYPDEDLDPFHTAHAADTLARVAQRCRELHESFARGQVLKRGLPTVLLGRPNSGKSSLLNALCGQDRAIVTDEAGTTRDVLDQLIVCDGAPVRLLDTAGLRDGVGKAEQMGIARTHDAARDAQAALWIVDAAAPLTQEDEQALALCRTVPHRAVVRNKHDLPPLPQTLAAIEACGIAPVFSVSAARGEGLSPLCAWLASLVPPSDVPLVTSARQSALLQSAAADLRCAADSARDGLSADAFLADAERAADTLGQLSGDVLHDGIADEIFRRFCVGK